MTEVLSSRAGAVVLVAAVLAITIAVGVYVIGRVRAALSQTGPGASELLSNFDELRSQGALSEEEYRTIKASLAERLRREVNDTAGSS